MAEIIILSYHDIEFYEENRSNSKKDFYSISSKKLKQQLEIIDKNDIQIINPNDLIGDFSPTKNCVLFTFDDGYSSHFKLAEEILNKRNISALFFPITSEIGEEGKMSSNQLQNLLKSGHEIGSHSHYHKNLENLKKDQIKAEINQSRSILDETTGKSVNFFAFPFGGYSDESLKLSEELGLKKCFSTDGIPNSNLNDFLLHRININKAISAKDFERIITGDKSYYKTRNRQLKYQSVLRSVLGEKVEKGIKEFIKRA